MATFLADNLKHRSCWRHLATSLHGVQGNMTENDLRQRFEHLLPCFHDGIACYNRSKRSGQRLPKKRWKMNSFTFDYHLENIWRSLSEEKNSKFARVGSLCFSLYRRERSRGLNMIKTADIFSKKFICVPIVCWDHWRLVIFCHFGETSQSKTRARCILLLDSAEMGAENIVPEIRKFVYDIFKAEGRPEMKDAIYRIPLVVPKVPQQRNDVDCGRFVLYFIKQFIDATPENFGISNGFPCFLILQMEQKWFDSDKFEEFCNELEKESSTQPCSTRVVRRCSQRMTKKCAVAGESSRQGAEVILID